MSPSDPPARPPRRQAVLLRQQALLARSAALREELALQLQPLEPPLVLAGRVQEAWQWLRARPEVPLAIVIGLLLVRPRRALRWSRALWRGWRRWRRLQYWLQA